MTVYRVRLHDEGTVDAIQRSTDAGATWLSFGLTPAPAATDPAAQQAGIVSPDGSLVAFHFPSGGGVPAAWSLGLLDTGPQPVALTGLPDDLGPVLASGLTGNPEIGYLLKPTAGATIYRSINGLDWEAVTVPRR